MMEREGMQERLRDQQQLLEDTVQLSLIGKGWPWEPLRRPLALWFIYVHRTQCHTPQIPPPLPNVPPSFPFRRCTWPFGCRRTTPRSRGSSWPPPR